jgi:macrodomain Ter protein organizer (MatP/YcbG family)
MRADGRRKSIKVDADTWRWLALEAVKLECPIGEVVGRLVQAERQDRRRLLARARS